MRIPAFPLNHLNQGSKSEYFHKILVFSLFLLILIAIQSVLSLSLFIDRKLPFGLIFIILILAIYIKNPLYAILGVIAARLITTGGLSFFTLGGIGIGPFEAAILMCFPVWILDKIWFKKREFSLHPLLPLFIYLLLLQVVCLFWTPMKSDAVFEILRIILIFLSFQMILEMVRSPEDYRKAIHVWIGASVFVVVLGLTTNWVELSAPSGDIVWQSASKGGRETGLGQNPNWYAMNISFSILPALGLFYITKRRFMRWLFLTAGVFVVFGALISGSRGIAGAIVIQILFVLFMRKNLWRVGLRLLVIFFLLFLLFLTFFRETSFGRGIDRIIKRGIQLNDARFQNWVVSYEMFFDTYGLGIGGGSRNYIKLLKDYNMGLYKSQYRYPHSIYFGLLAHYGVLGILFLILLVFTIFRIFKKTFPLIKGTDLEIIYICHLGGMIGYAAHGVVDFNYYEKPFWEFLALWVALSLAIQRLYFSGSPPPAGHEALPGNR